MAKKSTAIDVTQGVIWQQLLSLCVPIFFSSFFQQAYTLIGTYIVGQFGGKLALGGIQATMVLTELCIGFCVGVGAGCAVITEQFLDQNGRTILWRRYNRDDWALDRYGKLWSAQLPANDRLTVNGITYVHWYDCVTDYIL